MVITSDSKQTRGMSKFMSLLILITFATFKIYVTIKGNHYGVV